MIVSPLEGVKKHLLLQKENFLTVTVLILNLLFNHLGKTIKIYKAFRINEVLIIDHQLENFGYFPFLENATTYPEQPHDLLHVQNQAMNSPEDIPLMNHALFQNVSSFPCMENISIHPEQSNPSLWSHNVDSHSENVGIPAPTIGSALADASEEHSSTSRRGLNQFRRESGHWNRGKSRNNCIASSSKISSRANNHSDAASVTKQNSGGGRRSRQAKVSRLDNISDQCLVLPDAPNCKHCGAKRFHLEPPNFCCSGGQISIVAPSMPYDLRRLFTDNDEESSHFRNNVRTYNNNMGFTSFAAKYDSELTRNTKGVYTVCVQGQVYHFLNGLIQSDDKPSGIQLYFFDTDEELRRRVNTSDKL